MATIPTTEPTMVIAGDTVKWTRSLPDYPASSGWVLSYALRHATARIDIMATASGADHAVTVAASETEAWVIGRYDWAAFVTKAGERYQVGAGRIVVQPNLAATAPVDTRTHARKVLEAIEAVIEGRASKDQQEYRIGDRALVRTPLADLIRLRQTYSAEVRREDQAAALAAGKDPGNRILVRFRGAR